MTMIETEIGFSLEIERTGWATCLGTLNVIWSLEALLDQEGHTRIEREAFLNRRNWLEGCGFCKETL
jgi:hypothetical protein